VRIVDYVLDKGNVAAINGSAFSGFYVENLVDYCLEEGMKLTNKGALAVLTGRRTGRTPKNRFIVCDEETQNSVDWGEINKSIERDQFESMLAKASKHIDALGRPIFYQQLTVGRGAHSIRLDVYTETAWHALFARNMFVREEGEHTLGSFTILHLPTMESEGIMLPDGTQSDMAVVIDLTRRLILLAGSWYAGEMKKAVFSAMNYILPPLGVLPMHCSATISRGGEVTVLFGLSGTGKTTLSSSPDRVLIGDDEHGWNDFGVFNLEGGCYAKTYGLAFDMEPGIYTAVNRYGAILENVCVSDEGFPDFFNSELTENGRASYPITYIENAHRIGQGGHPKHAIFLTCDAFGVLPPVARLSPEQAVFHFISGYTAKVAGTEQGVDEPEATFSACFGAAFMPRRVEEYAELFLDKVRRHGVCCWLVNTGWTGGPYGVGSRIPLIVTRAIINSIHTGQISDFANDPTFGVFVPRVCHGVSLSMLDPRQSWADKGAYDRAANVLARKFAENTRRFDGVVSKDITDCCPRGGPDFLSC
jgi:phosphoenolpyruvate carboxykinase (ATP)